MKRKLALAPRIVAYSVNEGYASVSISLAARVKKEGNHRGVCFAGSVPEERLMRRVAQIGGGKIFGGYEFVTSSAFSLGDRFRSRSIAARVMAGLGYATHGWRLARQAKTAA